MARSCLLYYITDRKAFPGDEHARRKSLLDKIAEAATNGVDYIQLREKDLSARELESLAREAASIIHKLRSENPELRTALLINSRTDVALAVGADGVHLRADDVEPQDVRTAWECGTRNLSINQGQVDTRELLPTEPLIGVSCHSAGDVARAAANGASFAVFAPVFEKKGAAPAGLEALQDACRAPIPVLALGGVTLLNAKPCLRAGAAGIAAIRLFQENDVAGVVSALRDNRDSMPRAMP